jgi:hypothetical protein
MNLATMLGCGISGDKFSCAVVMVSNIVMCIRDCRRGFGLEIDFIYHFDTRPVTKINYSAIADFHILQTTIAHIKSFRPVVYSKVVPWYRFRTVEILQLLC